MHHLVPSCYLKYLLSSVTYLLSLAACATLSEQEPECLRFDIPMEVARAEGIDAHRLLGVGVGPVPTLYFYANAERALAVRPGEVIELPLGEALTALDKARLARIAPGVGDRHLCPAGVAAVGELASVGAPRAGDLVAWEDGGTTRWGFAHMIYPDHMLVHVCERRTPTFPACANRRTVNVPAGALLAVFALNRTEPRALSTLAAPNF